MGQALYRTYRPRSLSDVVGQEHVTETLKKALDSNNISHAYLFTGPRGVGKTSIARILAHEINGLEYSDDSNHIDIIEIDAASNGKVDEIRDLREKAHIAPSLAKYKIYIIDEVHMVTTAAFNALLKTLEEPPEHVIFILATTESHKLPDTIVSRTQRYSFKPIQPTVIAKQLGKIAEQEKINITPGALDILSIHGEGSLRDSTGLLDQARNISSSVNEETVLMMLGLAPEEALSKLLESYLGGKSSSEIMKQLNDLYDQGYQAGMVAKQLGQLIRQAFIDDSSGLSSNESLELLNNLIEVPASIDPERRLEVILLANSATASEQPRPAVKPASDAEQESTPKKIVKESVAKSAPEKKEEKKEPLPEQPVVEQAEAEEPDVQAGHNKSNMELDDKLWTELLSEIKKKYNTLYGILRMANPSFSDENTLDLKFQFDFHKKRMLEANNKKMVSDLIKSLTGKDMTIECHLDKSSKPKVIKEVAPKKSEPGQDISNISNIFNGAELLES
jgi:DNA polymerase-3 subunit gamma/tau